MIVVGITFAAPRFIYSRQEAGFANLRIQIGDTHPDTNVARELLRELYTNMGRPLDAEQYAEIPAPG